MKQFGYQITSIDPLQVGDSSGETKFTAPVTKQCPKVYVISDGTQIVYIGSTTQPLRSRLYGALRASGQNGYYGYAWKKSSASLSLGVWILDDVAVKKGKRCLTAETVEAEVVFLVRTRDGNWPAHQTEIHFHQSDAKHRRMASEIYEEVRKRMHKVKLSHKKGFLVASNGRKITMKQTRALKDKFP